MEEADPVIPQGKGVIITKQEVQEGEDPTGWEWSDGSREGGQIAGESRERGIYLGNLATVADGEMLGVTIAWEDGAKTVALGGRYQIVQCTAGSPTLMD